MTNNQKKTYQYMRHYQRFHRRPASIRDIAESVDLSPGGVLLQVRALVAGGHVRDIGKTDVCSTRRYLALPRRAKAV